MKLFKVLVFTLISYGTFAQGVKVPTKSPLQTIKQEFALSSVEIEYSRPAANGRKIFGDLVPFGKVWRTGANSATLITFGEDVKVNGTSIKAGKYTILSIPNKEEWKLLFCDPSTSVFNFKESSVIASVNVKPNAIPFKFESFSIVFGDQTDTSLKISILWENTDVEFEVTADIDEKVMAGIDKAMNIDTKPYLQAANYYYDNGKDLNKALVWATKAAELQPDAFWVSHLKAKIQAKLGDKKGAIETATKSLGQAKAASNQDYVTLNEKLIKSVK